MRCVILEIASNIQQNEFVQHRNGSQGSEDPIEFGEKCDLLLLVSSTLKDVMLGLYLKLASGAERRGRAFLVVEQMIKRKDTMRQFTNGGGV